jgi:outer membrane protein
MNKIKVTALLIASVFTSSAFAAEDLMQIFTKSLKSDPQLLAQAASRNAVNELDAQARANFFTRSCFNC